MAKVEIYDIDNPKIFYCHVCTCIILVFHTDTAHVSDLSKEDRRVPTEAAAAAAGVPDQHCTPLVDCQQCLVLHNTVVHSLPSSTMHIHSHITDRMSGHHTDQAEHHRDNHSGPGVALNIIKAILYLGEQGSYTQAKIRVHMCYLRCYPWVVPVPYTI